MKLDQIYEMGERLLREKKYGMELDGVETEFVLVNNRRILDRYTFRQRCIDGTDPTTACRVLGIDFSTPVIMSAMTAPIPAIKKDGLIQVAQGLEEAGSLMWVGTPAPKNLSEIVATGVPVAANMKPIKNRKKLFRFLNDFQEAGVNWVGIEIDAGQGTKIKDRPMVMGCVPLSFSELKEVRKAVSKVLIFKGVLSVQDAQRSIEAGADGIVISNHGGHTLDYLPHPFQVMDDIMNVASGKIEIMVDGGFRRGSDVLKGLAFGASLIGVGRPILYGLAVAGKEGVRCLIEEITNELLRLMSMVGAHDPRDVRRNILIDSWS
jgi:isopentenyl diphosphate isomerase/L-lactate dehydrogenase-like FMN-dependent dehydrogenase